MKYTIALIIFEIVGSLVFSYIAFQFNNSPIALLLLFSLALAIGWFAGGLRMILEQKKEMQNFLDQFDKK